MAAVWTSAAVVALVALALTASLPQVEPVVEVPVAWWALIIAFGITEAAVVHIDLRRESVTVSLTMIPLVVGLFVLSPVTLVLVRLAGSMFTLANDRRRVPMKLAVNFSAFATETALAALVFHALHTGGHGVASWLPALAGALAADAAVSLYLAVAISLYQRHWEGGVLASQLITLVNTVVDTSVGLITVTLLATEPAAVLLLGVVFALVSFSYRAHTSLRARHRDLAELYRITAEMADAVLEGRVMPTVLESTCRLFHADQAWLTVAVDDGSVLRLQLRGTDLVTATLQPDDHEARLHAAAVVRGEAFVPEEDVLVAPLRGDADAAAVLGVARRTGNTRSLGGEDLRLFATTANHVAVALANGRLVERLREHAAASEHQSLHDALTGLPNRTFFSRALAQHLATGRPAAVLLLDLDRFKEVNDTLGHQNGDVLLLQVAIRLRQAVRHDDVVARLGGDEFAILLPDVIDPRAATHAARGIEAAMVRSIEVADVAVDVGASIGVALAPVHGTDVGALLQRADVAMYQAKADQSGVALYEPERDRHTRARLSLVGELRTAIETGDLDVHYQPIMDLETGRPVGAEALVRWNHPTRGAVPPDELVPVAEQSGLIRDLTELVLDRSLEACARWRSRGWDLRVSVNLSARSLLQPTVVADVARALSRAGVPPEALCLELTETSIMVDPRRTVGALEGICALGVRVAVDDFGTGHSSLAYLKTLPVGEIKIDRSFVSSMATDPSDQAIVQSITDLAANLGLPVVAEGVEDPALGEVLRDMGCGLGQGFGFGRPMPSTTFEPWLADRLGGWRPVLVAG